MDKNFVYIDDYDLLGSNFYWRKGVEIGISKEDLVSVDLHDERVLVHKDIVQALKSADRELQNKEYRLYITEGYRSKDLYTLVNNKMKEKIGEVDTNRILNIIDMPHSTGKSVDVASWKDGKKIILHDKKDGINGYFVDFYKQSNRSYQELQEILIGIMQNNGFRLGKKREYFHFNYDPTSPKNY
ncbi:MAG: hypothetical protein HYX21_02415 [Candidatus Yanofskybacteria bacterium]|nr:hypothetical protein [Candidatus Yanofskybacteria bacterium]